MATTVSTDNLLQPLRDTLGTKMLGNEMRISVELPTTDEVFKYSIQRLAESLVKKAKYSGLKPIAESGKVAYVSRGSDFTDSAAIAAKVYAVWSENPMDLIIFCVQAMEDARQDAERSKSYEEEYRGRYINLLRDLAAAKNMKDVRELVRKREY